MKLRVPLAMQIALLQKACFPTEALAGRATTFSDIKTHREPYFRLTSVARLHGSRKAQTAGTPLLLVS